MSNNALGISIIRGQLKPSIMSWSLESQLEHSEALREEAHVMNFSLEESKSELASRLEVLESEKKQFEEKIVMLEAADAERMEQLKVATEGLTMCCADIEWVLTVCCMIFF